MPGGYIIDSARSLVLSRAWGVLTSSELTRYGRLLVRNPDLKPHFNQICDMREVTEMRADAVAVQELAGLNPFGAGARRAIVVTTEVAFGMARMYQILTETSPSESEVFRDFDQALAWLGVTAGKADILRALAEAPELPDTD